VPVAALIPTAIMSISAANLFTRSIYVEYVRPRDPERGGRGQPVVVAGGEVRRSRHHYLVQRGIWFNPAYSIQFQLIGSIIILQLVPTVYLGVITGWFHRWGLIIVAVVGLATSALMLYDTPQYSLAGTVVKAHFGGSA
jgi:solute:Na+ symporter, SSS family